MQSEYQTISLHPVRIDTSGEERAIWCVLCYCESKGCTFEARTTAIREWKVPRGAGWGGGWPQRHQHPLAKGSLEHASRHSPSLPVHIPHPVFSKAL